MARIVESKYFEDAYFKFKPIRSDNLLGRLLIRLLSTNDGKGTFLWQMRGNRIRKTVEDIINNFNDDTDYIVFSRETTPEEIKSYTDSHIYDNPTDADDDMTTGFLIFDDFTSSNPELRQFVIDMIKNNLNLGSSGDNCYVATNWRIILTGNIDMGSEFWKPEYASLFNNMEYDPATRRDFYDDAEDATNESVNYDGKREEQTPELSKLTPDQIKERIYTILYNAIKDGEISPEEYLIINEDGVVITDENDLDPEEMEIARKIEDLVDFDAMGRGIVKIYTKPLYLYIDDVLNEKTTKNGNL